MRIEWITGQPLEGYAVADRVAVALRLVQSLPMVADWTLTGRILEPCPATGRLRPTAMREQTTCTSEASGRAEAALMAGRLIAQWRSGVAA